MQLGTYGSSLNVPHMMAVWKNLTATGGIMWLKQSNNATGFICSFGPSNVATLNYTSTAEFSAVTVVVTSGNFTLNDETIAVGSGIAWDGYTGWFPAEPVWDYSITFGNPSVITAGCAASFAPDSMPCAWSGPAGATCASVTPPLPDLCNTSIVMTCDNSTTECDTLECVRPTQQIVTWCSAHAFNVTYNTSLVSNDGDWCVYDLTAAPGVPVYKRNGNCNMSCVASLQFTCGCAVTQPSRRRHLLSIDPMPAAMPVSLAVPAHPAYAAYPQAPMQLLNGTQCVTDSQCWLSAPPAMCEHPGDLNKACASCPAPMSGKRERSCVDGVCRCTPPAWLAVLDAKTPAAIAEGLKHVRWDGSTVCDVLMNVGASTPSEEAMRKVCVNTAYRAFTLRQLTGLNAPLAVFYDAGATWQYVVDMVRGLTIISQPDMTEYTAWKLLTESNIDPLAVFSLRKKFGEISSWFISGRGAQRAQIYLNEASYAAQGTPAGTIQESMSRVIRHGESLALRAVQPARIAGVMGAYTMLANKTTDMLSAKAKRDGMPPPTLREVPLATPDVPQESGLAHSRRLTWVFPDQKAVNVGPNSSCFVVDYVVRDVWRGVKATIGYYEDVFPKIVDRFDAEMGQHSTDVVVAPLPPLYPNVTYTIEGCSPTRNVTDVWQGILYGVEFVAVPWCVAARFLRQVVSLGKAGKLTNLTDDLNFAVGCPIERLQTCTIRHDFVWSLAMWGGTYALGSVLISVFAPFLLMPWIGASILFVFAFVWWTYAVSPNCLPLIPVRT